MKSLTTTTFLILGTSFMLLFSGCQSAKYGVLEKFDIHKRDILVERVKDGKASQQDAKEQFQTALERFTDLTQFDGGDLEKIYKKLNKELERSEARASEVKKRIRDIEDVSKHLFREWIQELEQYQNQDYKRISERQLEATQDRYEVLIGAMKKAEGSMHPVLVTFRDQVLFLKHNLNAQAIASLDTQTEVLRTDIQALISDMETSIAEADAFIESMNQGES